MFLGPCRDSGSHLSGGAHPSLSWTLELLGTSDPDLWGLYRALEAPVCPALFWIKCQGRCTFFVQSARRQSPPGTGRDPGATDAPRYAAQRKRTAEKSGSIPDHAYHDIGIAELIHGDIDGASEPDTKEFDAEGASESDPR